MLNTTRQHRRPRIRTALTALALAGLLATLAACNTGASFGVDDQDPNVRGTFSGYFMWATEEPTTALGAIEPAAAADLVERAADAIAPDRDPRFSISIVATFATPEEAEEQADAVREILAASARWYADPANEAAAAQLSDDERPAPFTPPEKDALEERLLAPGERGVGWGGEVDGARDAVYTIGPILVVTGLKSETAEEAQAAAEVGADPPLHPLAHLLAAAGGDVLLEGDRYGEGSIVADVSCRPADGESATALLDELGDAILIGGQFWARPPWIGEPLTPKEALARATFRRWQQGAAAAMSDPKLQDLAQRIAGSTPAESEAAMREFEAHIRERGLELMDGEFDPGVLALILDTGSQADDDARQAWTRELGERMGRLAVEEGPYGDQPAPDDYAQVPFTGSVRVNAERLEIGWLSFARLAAGLPSLGGYLTARGCDDIRVKLVDYDAVRGN